MLAARHDDDDDDFILSIIFINRLNSVDNVCGNTILLKKYSYFQILIVQIIRISLARLMQISQSGHLKKAA